MYNMYYNRTLSKGFARLLEKNGELRWLFDFVIRNNELDFLIGKTKTKEWISVYRGLSRFLTILPLNASTILVDADDSYREILSGLYGTKQITDNFQKDIEQILSQVKENPEFDRYYNNKKEGYYQNELSRKFGICGPPDSNFVIIDKESVIGYENQNEKDAIFGKLREEYKNLQEKISCKNAGKYGQKLEKKPIGNELDFLALDKDGNILLIEYKHGTNTSGIYLSPLQIGLYYDIFTAFPRSKLETAVFQMLEQKQEIGLINPGWQKPTQIKDIIPVLIISEYNYKGSAKNTFGEILQIARENLGNDFLHNLQTFNFSANELKHW